MGTALKLMSKLGNRVLIRSHYVVATRVVDYYKAIMQVMAVVSPWSTFISTF